MNIDIAIKNDPSFLCLLLWDERQAHRECKIHTSDADFPILDEMLGYLADRHGVTLEFVTNLYQDELVCDCPFVVEHAYFDN
jgi:hypothetical protein